MKQFNELNYMISFKRLNESKVSVDDLLSIHLPEYQKHLLSKSELPIQYMKDTYDIYHNELKHLQD